MSLKENINSVKDELNTEEQFLESIIKSERFVKKYKSMLIGLVLVFVVGIGGYSIYDLLNTHNIKKSNEAYNKLLEYPDDKEALEVLKNKNHSLYLVHQFNLAVKNNDKKALEELSNTNIDPLLKDLALYESKNDGKILLGSFQFLLNGYALLKEGKTQEAQLEFAKIPFSSSLHNVAKNLEHYRTGEK